MRDRNGERDARWRAAAAEDLVWLSWGGDHVAYHRSSGKTHFLNDSSHFLLTELLREPRDIEAVAAAFGAGEGEGEDAGARHEVASMLAHFEELGLIERVWPA